MGIVKGLFAGETDAAVCIQQGHKKLSHIFWIPRSIITYMRKTPAGQVTEIIAHVPDWWLNKPENKKIEF